MRKGKGKKVAHGKAAIREEMYLGRGGKGKRGKKRK